MKFLSTPTTMCCCASWHFMQSQSRIQCKEMRSKMVQLFCSTNQFSCVFQCQEQFSRDLCIWISWGGLSFFWFVLETIPSPIIPYINLYHQSISYIYIYAYIYTYIYIYIYIKHPSININHSGCRAWNRSPPPALPRCHALPRQQGMPLLDAVLEKKVRLGSNDELLGYTWIHHIFIVDINIYLPIWAYCNIMVYHKLLIKKLVILHPTIIRSEKTWDTSVHPNINHSNLWLHPTTVHINY